MSNLIEIFKYLSLLLYLFFSKYKINNNVYSSTLIGVGTGIVANVMFTLTSESKYNLLKLVLSFVFGIILLLLGSLEKKEK
jgi:peptidoglycan/LPS O-acetylase OafA/YrhL